MTTVAKHAGQGHWARLEERGVYAGLWIMFWAYRVLGRRVFSAILYVVIFYFLVTGRSAYRASQTFLSRVYDDRRGRATLKARPGWRQSFRHFMTFGEAILDKLAAWTGEITSDDIVYHDKAIFDALRAQGRGGLLIASHLGNMEVCRALAQLSIGLKLNVLVHTKHASNFNRLLRKVSPDSGIALFQTTEVDAATAIWLNQRVAAGELVVIVGDRIPVSGSGRVSRAPLLGYSAPFPQGPYILASLFRCPVQLIFCLKQSGRYHIYFEPFADLIELPRKARNETLDKLVRHYAERLEHYCTIDPYQWFNFFDFWSQADLRR